MISVIIPAYQEAQALPDCLLELFESQPVGECWVIDASKTAEFEAMDAQLQQTIDWPYLHYVAAELKGRAHQMNQGANLSSGAILLFLHADTRLPENAFSQIQSAIDSGAHWGRFDVSFDHSGRVYRMIAGLMSWRSRKSGIATGDQALFMTRGAFDLAGGYDDIPLMEDIAICRKLKTIGSPACLKAQVKTSARRWEEKGVFRTIVLMWWLRFAYWTGVSPQRLSDWYR